MPRWVALALCCLFLIASAASQTDAPKQAQALTIQGKVVDAKSGEPIRKVEVQLVGGPQHSANQRSVVTGADGTFAITDPEPGTYRVTLQRPGFVQTRTSLQQTRFTLEAGKSLSDLLLKMQAAGVISGKIVDADGDPLNAVSVEATNSGTGARPEGVRRSFGGAGITNDLGEYRIPNLPAGRYLLRATPSRQVRVASGEAKENTSGQMIYGATYYPGTLDQAQAVAVAVRSSEEATANFAVQATRAYHVSGTVVGVPSGGMSLLLLFSKDGGDVRDGSQQVLTGNQFRYENILPGTYIVLLVSVKGVLNNGVPGTETMQLRPTIEVDKSDVDGVQLHVEPGGQVRGKFRLDSAGPFDWTQLNVRLEPVDENGARLYGMMTFMLTQASLFSTLSNDGSFELKNVPAGNYQVVVGAHSDKLRDYYTKSVLLGGKDVADSGFAVSGEAYLDVVVSAKGATVEGTVVDDKGQPVDSCAVVAVPNEEHGMRADSYQQGVTDQQGHFAMHGLSPGSYIVLALEDLAEDIHDPEFSKRYGAKGEKLDLPEGGRKSLTLKVIAAEDAQ